MQARQKLAEAFEGAPDCVQAKLLEAQLLQQEEDWGGGHAGWGGVHSANSSWRLGRPPPPWAAQAWAPLALQPAWGNAWQLLCSCDSVQAGCAPELRGHPFTQ